MGHTIIKPVRDEDFYVVYSSVVDSLVNYGTRAELVKSYSHADAERFERADKEGTSSLCEWEGRLDHGWWEDKILVAEGIVDPARPDKASHGLVRRVDLRAFCESSHRGFFCPPPGLVQWITEDD